MATWMLCGSCVERPLTPGAGDPTATAVQRFASPSFTSATILWVIDDSASMCEEQRNLRVNVSDFLDGFLLSAPAARFHIGVVSTDLSDPASAGRLRTGPGPNAPDSACPPEVELDCAGMFPGGLPRWVDEAMVESGEAGAALACLAQVGTAGSGVEAALGAALLALSPPLADDPAANGGFVIPGSLVVVLFAGDEDDCSVCAADTCAPLDGVTSNLDCAIARADELTPIANVVARFGALVHTDGRPIVETGFMPVALIGLDATGHSAGPLVADLARPGELLPICTVLGQGSAAPAPRIEAFVRAFDDYALYNICDDDYGRELTEVGSRVGCTGGPRWCLDRPPCPGLTANDVVVRIETSDGQFRTLVPFVDFDVTCAGAYTAPCPASSDTACPEGWRVEMILAPPPGALLEMSYPFDAGDGCSGPAAP